MTVLPPSLTRRSVLVRAIGAAGLLSIGPTAALAAGPRLRPTFAG